MATAKKEARNIPCTDGVEAIRCNRVYLATARPYQPGAVAKFSITMMFDKTKAKHIAALKQLKADLEACRVEQWPDEATRPRTPLVAETPVFSKSPIKDADIAVNENGIPLVETNPEYAGHYVVRISCNEDRPPVIVDGNKAALNPNMCRSGYHYKVNCNAYAYVLKSGSGGVTVGLNGVQLIREDEVFGGGAPSADSMFSSVEGGDASAYQSEPAGGLGEEASTGKSASNLLGGDDNAAGGSESLL